MWNGIVLMPIRIRIRVWIGIEMEIRIPDCHQHHDDPQHWPQCKDRTSFRQQTVVGTVLGSDVHFGKLDPDPHQTGKLDPDPHLHHSEKVKA